MSEYSTAQIQQVALIMTDCLADVGKIKSLCFHNKDRLSIISERDLFAIINEYHFVARTLTEEAKRRGLDPLSDQGVSMASYYNSLSKRSKDMKSAQKKKTSKSKPKPTQKKQKLKSYKTALSRSIPSKVKVVHPKTTDAPVTRTYGGLPPSTQGKGLSKSWADMVEEAEMIEKDKDEVSLEESDSSIVQYGGVTNKPLLTVPGMTLTMVDINNMPLYYDLGSCVDRSDLMLECSDAIIAFPGGWSETTDCEDEYLLSVTRDDARLYELASAEIEKLTVSDFSV
jgi:hypothetical protein